LQQQPQQQPHWQQQQGAGVRRQAGPAAADASVVGKCLAGSEEAGVGAGGHAAASASTAAGAGAADAAFVALQHTSSGTCWGTGAGHAAGSVDANNNSNSPAGSHSQELPDAYSNNAALQGSSSGGGCGSSGGSTGAALVSPCAVPEWCDAGRVGAVVVQAWPGRQRGQQLTAILVAGGSHMLPWKVEVG
jgi:hypothetical protein